MHMFLLRKLILSQECVICRTVYLTEVDWAGRERLVPEDSGTSMVTPVISNKGKGREVEIEVSGVFMTLSRSDGYVRIPNLRRCIWKQVLQPHR